MGPNSGAIFSWLHAGIHPGTSGDGQRHGSPKEAAPPLGYFRTLSSNQEGSTERRKYGGWTSTQSPPFRGVWWFLRTGGWEEKVDFCDCAIIRLGLSRRPRTLAISFIHSLTHPFIDCLVIQPLPQNRLCTGPREAEVKEERLLTSVKGTSGLNLEHSSSGCERSVPLTGTQSSGARSRKACDLHQDITHTGFRPPLPHCPGLGQ